MLQRHGNEIDVEEAQEAILNEQLIRLSPKAYDDFLKVISAGSSCRSAKSG